MIRAPEPPARGTYIVGQSSKDTGGNTRFRCYPPGLRDTSVARNTWRAAGHIAFAGQPILDLPPAIADGFRAFEDAGVGNQPDETQEAGPWQTHARDAVEPVIQSGMHLLVLRNELTCA